MSTSCRFRLIHLAPSSGLKCSAVRIQSTLDDRDAPIIQRTCHSYVNSPVCNHEVAHIRPKCDGKRIPKTYITIDFHLELFILTYYLVILTQCFCPPQFGEFPWYPSPRMTPSCVEERMHAHVRGIDFLHPPGRWWHK